MIALIIGAGVGYFGNNATTRTTTGTITATVIKIYTTTVETYTTTYPAIATSMWVSGVAQCIVTEYHVWALVNSSEMGEIASTSTQSYAVQTYQTSTMEPTVGFATTFATPYTRTLTGAIAYWNSTVCTLISG